MHGRVVRTLASSREINDAGSILAGFPSQYLSKFQLPVLTRVVGINKHVLDLFYTRLPVLTLLPSSLNFKMTTLSLLVVSNKESIHIHEQPVALILAFLQERRPIFKSMLISTNGAFH